MKKLALLGLFLFCGAGLFAQGANVWLKKASFDGSKRARALSFALGSRGYICCGEDTAENVLNDLWEYDPGTDSWSQKASLPAPARRDAASFVIGNKAYVGTGMDATESFLGNVLNDFWEYDPVMNSWTQKANYPGGWAPGVYFATGFAVNGKGYICCGKQSASYYSNELWQYDPVLNTWALRAPFPAGVRYAQTSFVVGNYAYVGTGTDENYLVNEFYRYDPVMNQWAQRAPVPTTPRFAAFGFSIGSKGYITLGSDGGYQDDLYEYDPPTNTWATKSPFGGGERRSGAGFVIGNFAYLGTGKATSGKRRDFWMYVPHVTGIDEAQLKEKGFDVFPNPVHGQANIVIEESFLQNEKALRFELFDLSGKKLLEEQVDASFSLSCEQLAPGTYLGRLVSATRAFAAAKILVN